MNLTWLSLQQVEHCHWFLLFSCQIPKQLKSRYFAERVHRSPKDENFLFCVKSIFEQNETKTKKQQQHTDEMRLQYLDIYNRVLPNSLPEYYRFCPLSSHCQPIVLREVHTHTIQHSSTHFFFFINFVMFFFYFQVFIF